MTNKEIANKFQELASLMELHGENKFRIRSYSSAYITLRKQSDPLSEMSDDEIGAIKGVGNAISGKIRELLNTGEMEAMKKYQDKTPQGIQDMLKIKGFGPKKISVIWKELEVESVGELLYACNENRLVELNGFGQKTQADLKNKLEYFLVSKNKFHYASLEKDANVLLEKIQNALPDAKVSWVGEMRRACPIVNVMEFLVASDEPIDSIFEMDFLSLEKKEANHFVAKNEKEKPVTIFTCSKNEFGSKLFRYSSSDEFLKAFIKNNDGINTLREMAEYSKKLGYDYLGITDHSQAAFYANGLKEDRVMQQFAEIDTLNEELAPFKIFKGIESDILNDGSLDYPTDVLRQFDFIIASVHSNLKMDKEKATNRLLKAIENRYTTILGHPTGRLLLSRTGYPIDHKKIIDACATYGVAIELNSNPYRLDLDWTWIPYALEKGVMISINPDAHSTGGIHDIHFGVLPARKGRLTKEMCLNAKSVEDFAKFIAI